MTSITGLSKAQMLTQALEFISQALANCGFDVCSIQRTHGEPRKVQCCETCDGGYALVGWIIGAYPSDGRLNEVPSASCPTLDATVFGFTVARCWPESSTIPKVGGVMDETAVVLADVLDCLQAALGSCENNPVLFHGTDEEEAPMRCIRVQVGRYQNEKAEIVTPYGDTAEGGKVSLWCAGWAWTITVA